MQARRATTDRQGRSAFNKLKRAARAGGLAKILIDTGALFNTLNIGSPGNLVRYVKDGIRFGIDGSIRHPSGEMTLGGLATAHGNGVGNLPKREILIRPNALSDSTRRGMIADVQRMFDKIGPKVRDQ